MIDFFFLCVIICWSWRGCEMMKINAVSSLEQTNNINKVNKYNEYFNTCKMMTGKEKSKITSNSLCDYTVNQDNQVLNHTKVKTLKKIK